ncbi:hypothetical protein [uncultured Flavonifractor sp.]|uniref:hypothetical protein n=1 Tax=uncultured Flavonifractor sp. TaxID=1193534 RepID=UPI002637D783|nr:hypothetical protein [uncultured Flavonifractor sp.]
MKRTAVILLAAAILVSGAAAYASGVLTGESLISKSYLNLTYLPDVEEQVSQRVEERTQAAYQSALEALNQKHSAYLALAAGEQSYASALTDLRFKAGDVVTLSAGSGGMLLAGSASLSYSGSGVVDVTAGQAASSGSALSLRHRYLAGEQTTASITVTSDTAVLSVEGYYSVAPSSGVDYNALADALAALGLFQGSGTAYGSGYDLEVSSTRIMGVVMFLRLIGEEEAALSSTAVNPFADTPAWCDRYVAYAYEKGYTNGVGSNSAGQPCFAPDREISAEEYMTLILRALGYTDSGSAPDFTWDTAVVKSVEWGVLTAGEQAMLAQREFLRAQIVYLSYFSLNAARKDGGVLLDRTVSSGGPSRSQFEQVMSGVSVPRL